MAHCGPTLKGEFARTLNLTCVHTGWVVTSTVRSNVHVNILKALRAGVDAVPFEVTALDFDNGSEFLNKPVIAWAAEREIFFTRSRPDRKNDQATIESKNNHLVRKYGFCYRYDTTAERAVLNRLWRLVNDRLNYLTPTKKPVGFGIDRNGRRTRLNPAQTARDIAHHQAVLLTLAKDKTEQLYLASLPSAVPDVRQGIHIKAS